MEKTIEERAREHFGDFYNGRCIAYDDISEKAYILGATEQKGIDKVAMLDQLCKHQKEEMELINKACGLLNKWLDDFGMVVMNKDDIEDYRNELEELL